MRDFGAIILLSVAATAAAPSGNARIEQRPATKPAMQVVRSSSTADQQMRVAAVDNWRR